MKTFPLLLATFLAGPAHAQFAPGASVTNLTDRARHVEAADLDGDGDLDVLSASAGDDTVAWYENLGGSFGPQRVISSSMDWAAWVEAADLDGDGDLDVLAAAHQGHQVQWFSNLGGGVFAGPAVIDAQAMYTFCARAADLDGDGDVDVVSAHAGSGQVASYENLGAGMFGPPQVVQTGLVSVRTVQPVDLDGDGALDLLSAAAFGNLIAWSRNLGGGTFGPLQWVDSSAQGPLYADAADLDGDGDLDVLAATYLDDTIAWYPNAGGGTFGTRQVINAQALYAHSAFAADLDGDLDLDVLIASHDDDTVAWHENLGGGMFGTEQVLSSIADGAVHAFAADLENDGDVDVLSASRLGNEIAWYENLMGPAWHVSPVNGHWYRRTDFAGYWPALEAQALQWGGHLVTIRSQAEEVWLQQTFPTAAIEAWIGFNDIAIEGSWVWSSGEPVTYAGWCPGQPDNNGDEDWGRFDCGGLGWGDSNAANTPAGAIGLIEVISGDCNGDQVPDAYQIAQDPTLDWNGDGVLDSCASPNYCGAVPNSFGTGASIAPTGSPLLALNDFGLETINVSPNQYAYFVASMNQGFVANPGGSQGNLCIGSGTARFKSLAAASTLGGVYAQPIDLTLFPTNPPQAVVAGQTWNFQCWYRDVNPAPTSNFSDATAVMFR